MNITDSIPTIVINRTDGCIEEEFSSITQAAFRTGIHKATVYNYVTLQKRIGTTIFSSKLNAQLRFVRRNFELTHPHEEVRERV